ncbi:MAG: carboxylating nicotinate-nucleotide diphosphorylase [Candidatus Ancillula trichonymphae]|jgi:nicotinate-nucleotide pyrophosphorylase (carboxylating)|nr:carboxylating nicotinate-nucleotide diphosphorylase [Candidatus Ancillula trichonymphae]
MNTTVARKKIAEFLLEDIGTGDVCSSAVFGDQTLEKEAVFVAKSSGIIAGVDVAKLVFEELGDVKFEAHIEDGCGMRPGDVIARVHADVKVLLAGERVALNLLQRMSAVALNTKLAIEELGDPTIRICDTRKTAPGLRIFDKAAVRIGGGYNHRFGLYDALMLKDNHIAFSGSITASVEKLRSKIGHTQKIEVEVTNEDQVLEAVDAGVDIIMFDNCAPSQVKRMRVLVPEHIITECSGSITLENLRQFANTGVDYISLGFLTHSFQALDISFQALDF